VPLSLGESLASAEGAIGGPARAPGGSERPADKGFGAEGGLRSMMTPKVTGGVVDDESACFSMSRSMAGEACEDVMVQMLPGRVGIYCCWERRWLE
jgi:hypothetical protein